MLYEKCAEVSGEFWQELGELLPGDVARRTGVAFKKGRYRLPFLNRKLIIDPAGHWLEVEGAGGPEPDFRLCLTALLYLTRVDTGALGTLISPLELTGGTAFFTERGPHALPRAPLEKRFGDDLEGFLLAGNRLGAKRCSGRRRRSAIPGISRVGSGDHPLAGGCGVPGPGVFPGARPS